MRSLAYIQAARTRAAAHRERSRSAGATRRLRKIGLPRNRSNVCVRILGALEALVFVLAATDAVALLGAVRVRVRVLTVLLVRGGRGRALVVVGPGTALAHEARHFGVAEQHAGLSVSRACVRA